MKCSHGLVLVCCILVALSFEIAAAEQWPQWRGPLMDGSTTEHGLPSDWDKDKDALWVMDLPGPGSATPIVWDDYVFVTASDKESKQVLAIAVDGKTGTLRWKTALGPDRKAGGNNSMASPSPVTDGKFVWYLTGTGQLTALTFDGQTLWNRNLAAEYGQFEFNFGYSSSPLLFDGRLYVLVLQNDKPNRYGMNVDRTKPLESYLLAVDPAAGKTLWKHVRDTNAQEQSRESYVTPYPYEWQGRKEIILAGGECVTGHDPAGGAELWRWWFTPQDGQTLQHNVPTPVAHEGLIFVIRPEHRPLFALRAGGAGRLDASSVAWTFEANRCWITTPAVYRNRLYVLQENEKTLICFEPQTGRIVWQHELPVKTSFEASPLAADGKIYCISLAGEVVVLAAGDEYELLASIDMDDRLCRSSFSAAGGKLYIRTGSKLYCVGEH
ncbi:MAG: PQQ-binding-like beta-propeller repeat protein [Planctomycetaceae bacterium]|nr:PQQ-binding-like beta-propeller repeat protein [Planctomycetaceae bacterium]